MVGEKLSAGDATWVATALLHRKFPEKSGFTVREIVQCVEKHELTALQPMTIYQHANQHCVANRAPNSAKLRMLLETPEGLRRLYRDGDPLDPRRVGSRQMPTLEHLPEQYRELLDWYQSWNQQQDCSIQSPDPLLALVGTWSFGQADEYVHSLRDNWE